MSTFAQMQSRIADDLNRSDLTTQIQLAINRAIEYYSKEAFWFNDSTWNFTTNIGQQIYTQGTGVSNIPQYLRHMYYLRVNQNTNSIYTASGAANTYAITASPAPTAYSTSDAYRFYPNADNTGACTLNVNGLGAISIKTFAGSDPAASDIVANRVTSVTYNGTNFVLQASNAIYYPLRERSISDILLWNVNNNQGLPTDFAFYQNQIYIYPNPDQVYELSLYYQPSYVPLSSSTDTNAFTTNPEAEELIEMRAEWWLYNRVIMDDVRAQKCKEAELDALRDIRQITEQLVGVSGNIRATTF